jgi:hypothetical protein
MANASRCSGLRVSGATLRRRPLAAWTFTGVLQQLQACLIRRVRSGLQRISAPCCIVADSCSVRAKRGGDLIGPNPTDRGKSGTKCPVVVDADGLPLAAVASAANVNDTRLLHHLLNTVQERQPSRSEHDLRSSKNGRAVRPDGDL